MATIKIYKGSFYMRNYYNNPRPQLSNMSFLFICKYMSLQVKASRAYSRILGKRSILARKFNYEKCTFLKKGPRKFTTSPPLLLNPFYNFYKRRSVGLNIGLQWSICPGIFTVIFTLFL